MKKQTGRTVTASPEALTVPVLAAVARGSVRGLEIAAILDRGQLCDRDHEVIRWCHCAGLLPWTSRCRAAPATIARSRRLSRSGFWLTAGSTGEITRLPSESRPLLGISSVTKAEGTGRARRRGAFWRLPLLQFEIVHHPK